MNWTIPGTVLKAERQDAQYIPEQFQSMFLAGGMVLSQVASITGVETHTIQNWVKRGFLTPPVNKRYTLRQLCRIININMLRGTLPLDRICALLGYVNGQLNDERDDIIDDAELYFMFIKLASTLRDQYEPQQRQMYLEPCSPTRTSIRGPHRGLSGVSRFSEPSASDTVQKSEMQKLLGHSYGLWDGLMIGFKSSLA